MRSAVAKHPFLSTRVDSPHSSYVVMYTESREERERERDRRERRETERDMRERREERGERREERERR